MNLFLGHDLDCPAVEIQEFTGHVKVGTHLRLDHLLLYLAHGIDIPDEMPQIFLGCIFKGLGETIQGEEGDAQERNQDHKQGHADELCADTPIFKLMYEHLNP